MKPIKQMINPVLIGVCLYGTEPKTHKPLRTSRVLDIRLRDGIHRVQTRNTFYDCNFTDSDVLCNFTEAMRLSGYAE